MYIHAYTHIRTYLSTYVFTWIPLTVCTIGIFVSTGLFSSISASYIHYKHSNTNTIVLEYYCICPCVAMYTNTVYACNNQSKHMYVRAYIRKINIIHTHIWTSIHMYIYTYIDYIHMQICTYLHYIRYEHRLTMILLYE